MSLNLLKIVAALSGKVPVSWIGASASTLALDPNTATAGIRINTNGDQEKFNPFEIFNHWLLALTSADFDVRATHTGGVLPDGTFGTWLNLATSHQWSITQSTVGTSNSTFDLEIRFASNGQILDIASFDLTATQDVA